MGEHKVRPYNIVMPDFPIQSLLPDILSALDGHARLVLEAPPGAGKTTQVPLALRTAGWLQGRKILMLEPRRVAARAAAGFMARQLDEAVGETVGYRIRFESKVSAATRIEVLTEGLLTRRIQDDPLLEDVGAIVFDEFHERHLAGDLGLALALDIQRQLRPDLRILVMSATLDGERLAAQLDAPRLSSEGRSFPVEIAHFAARKDEVLNFQAKRAVEQALQQHPGDVLVFLPGRREINALQDALAALAGAALEILPLHGDLPIEQQTRALEPAPEGVRRVVLASNVAESSVTLPGVRVVIDSGLAREPRFDPNSGFSRLEVTAISQASADQRAGRAGRVSSGWCYRLWPASQRLEPMRRAEIQHSELGALALELAAWGSMDLPFVDAPPSGALQAGRDLLQSLGALDDSGRITPLGKRMLGLGTHPRLAAMLLAVHDEQEKALACDLAALIEARDPLLGARRDDWQARWQALADFRARRSVPGANAAALKQLDLTAAQWRRRVRCEAKPPASVPAHALGDVLLHAFPDRIAKQHDSEPLRYQLASGRMARLHPESSLYGEPWLCASELRFEAKEALVLRAAPIDEHRLRDDFPERFREDDVVRWDETRNALLSRREKRFAQIVLSSQSLGKVDPELAAAALCAVVRQKGLSVLPWSGKAAQFRARVGFLRRAMPELGLPDCGDAALLDGLETWLKPALRGKSRLDALDTGDLGEALYALFDWNTRRQVDRLAPAALTVPSGLERTLSYDEDGPPVLAVKLQELFGLAKSPKVADGRVTVMLHLLSPGGKPLQITQDLRNFWNSTYAEVKKEMKGRYPRHPWPDDPWNAPATHRAKPRGT
ncbi:ATP-dependent helicase HrpB [Arenimonas maotaiensis]|uniref:ATP-dependent helicase HrpB n=1 Tax=Arenimonas maotaiensis TaxID=1446479 RepID=A0A917FQ72_9GAMM|nr:ATP-dependent helicase HrpB [Arenimonas maotaiensis]